LTATFLFKKDRRNALHYFDVYYEINGNESVLKNPSVTNLYNATKFSGRTNSGLGIGILNSVSRPTFAIIKNNETGEERKIETNPMTNYSLIVFDQSLKNNSKISFENT